MVIRDSLPKLTKFYEYIGEIVIFMIMTGKKCSGLDILPKTPNWDTSIKDIIFTIWYKKAMKYK